PQSSTLLPYTTLFRSELEAGRQMFVVCPLIAESDALPARSVEEVFKELSTKSFKHRNVGLLHGKMKPDEKDAVMQRFIKHELDRSEEHTSELQSRENL